MKIARPLPLLLALALPACVPPATASDPPSPGHSAATIVPSRAAGSTTVVVVRHAEKADDDPRDPTLTAAGRQRADALVGVLEDAAVSAIYSTQYRRNRSTVEPLAARLGLPVTVREIAASEADAYADALSREILARHAGGSVVVVGHSNTVPQIVRALSGQLVAEITEQEYDHFFLVVVPPGGEREGGGARLFRLRFGAPDPRPPGPPAISEPLPEAVDSGLQ
jgi:broad specificity phosphatase PhoE